MNLNLRLLREQRHLTQVELAKRSEVSRATINQLENHHTKVTSTKTLLKIAKALGVTVDQLFFEADD